MKQGTGKNTMSGQKREPISKAINPGAVSQIGIHEVNLRKEPMVTGRGYKAPMASTTVHHRGTQGKHK